ncbi:MAG: hypothetical protein WD751_02220 [Anaerolineales bacterium]
MQFRTKESVTISLTQESLVQRLARLGRNAKSDWWIIAAVGLLFILIAAFSGLIQNFLNSEEFLIYSYANNFPHDQAWLAFFHRFGRPIEAIYWTYQYKLIGFNPLLNHTLSFVQLLSISILASACFLNAWPPSKRSKFLPYVFVFSLFINWVSTSSILRLSYDNGRISLIFFFLAGLALQRWAVHQRTRWLILSLALFLISVLTYENAAFLFPALVLLAMPLLPAPQTNPVRFRLVLFAGLSAASGLILVITRWLYNYVFRPVATPALDLKLGDLPIRLIEKAPSVYLQFGQIINSNTFPVNSLIAIGLLLTLVLSSLWIVRTYSNRDLTYTTETRSYWLPIYMASLWLLIFGPMPYVLLGYDVGGRVYSSAVFGVFPLVLMVYQTARSQFLRSIGVFLLLMFAVFGLLMVRNESVLFNQWEAPLNVFYRGLKGAVPYVRQGTVFIFIDGPVGNQGCAPSLQMLYNKDDLDCLVVYPDFEQNGIRRATELEAFGKDVNTENSIFLIVTNNFPSVVDELKPGDFNLFITWESTEPMQTDFGRIVTREIPPPSDFYLHLLERAKVLFPDR